MDARNLALLGLLARRPALGAALAAPEAADWDAVLDLAIRQGAAPLALRGLESLGADAAPEAIRMRLRQERHATALENLRHYGEFKRIATAFAQDGIALIALKGLHLAELVYRDVSLRPMVDMDILVPARDLERAVARLQGLGYGGGEALGASAAATMGAKCNVGLRHERLGIWLEVHWDIAEPSGGRASPVDEIWRRARPGRIGDADVAVMAPELLLLHVSAHLAFGHKFLFSVRALCDIAEIARAHRELDWPLVAGLALRSGWRTGVAAALQLAKRHLDAQIPEQALALLGAERLDAELLGDAMEQVFETSEIPAELLTAPSLLALGGVDSAAARAAMAWKRIFVPAEELATLYGVPRDAASLPLYYFVRLRDLLRTYAASGWRIVTSDARVGAAAARHARLSRWLES